MKIMHHFQTLAYVALLGGVLSLAAPFSYALTETDSFQTGTGTATFTPTYTVPSNDLLLGLTYSSVGSDPTTFMNAANGHSADNAGGVGVLTDGSYGTDAVTGTSTHSNFALGGAPDAGLSITYTLKLASNITSIVTLGGWTDTGRDQQAYSVYYATNGGALTLLGTANYLPPNSSSVQYATQVTLNNFGTLSNVTQIEFVFTSGAENGYEGYNELEALGSAVPEPSAWMAVVLLGSAGLVALRWRSRPVC